VDIREDEQSLVELSVKANYRSLGPRLGSRMKDAAKAVAALGASEIRTLLEDKPLDIQLAEGESDSVRITQDDVIIHRTEKSGMTVANDGAITVALDISLNDNLVREGWAREIVNRLQNIRKDAGFEVTDRIAVVCELPDPVAVALDAFKQYISDEVLADSVERGNVSHGSVVDIEGNECKFQVALV